MSVVAARQAHLAAPSCQMLTTPGTSVVSTSGRPLQLQQRRGWELVSAGGRRNSSRVCASDNAIDESLKQLPKRQGIPPGRQPVYYPGPEEEARVSLTAFHNALDAARPKKLAIPGLQEWAAAILGRRRYASAGDPLMHLFDEYDADSDGRLTSEEIAKAFQSGSVNISAEQVRDLICDFEDQTGSTCSAPIITKDDWPDFIHSLAISDLHAVQAAKRSGSSGSASSDSMDLV